MEKSEETKTYLMRTTHKFMRICNTNERMYVGIHHPE